MKNIHSEKKQDKNHARVNLITCLAMLLFIAFAPQALAASGGDEKPNIVLVLMDNFGYGEVGVYGGGVLRGAPTPNIDSMAAEGLQLTNYNVEAECTPSRAALMTGRYGIRTRPRPDGPVRDDRVALLFQVVYQELHLVLVG